MLENAAATLINDERFRAPLFITTAVYPFNAAPSSADSVPIAVTPATAPAQV